MPITGKFTYPSEEGDVEAGSITVDKLEGKQLEDQGIIVHGLCAVIFCHQKMQTFSFLLLLCMHTEILFCSDVCRHGFSSIQNKAQIQMLYNYSQLNSIPKYQYVTITIHRSRHKQG